MHDQAGAKMKLSADFYLAALVFQKKCDATLRFDISEVD